jgi:hypothetical protein
MENIEAILKSMNENLELIAEAILKATVGNVPAFVKVAQDVLEAANEVVEVAVSEAVVDAVEDRPAKVEKTDGKTLTVGVRVSALTAKKTKGISIGDEGLITDDNEGIGVWRTVIFKSSTKPVKMRCGELVLLEGDAQVPNDEVPSNEEEVAVEAVEDSSNEKAEVGVSTDPATAEGANYVFTAGAHKNNTVHGIYTGSDRGAKFITWSAGKHKDETAKTSCASYLKAVGV